MLIIYETIYSDFLWVNFLKVEMVVCLIRMLLIWRCIHVGLVAPGNDVAVRILLDWKQVKRRM